MHSDLRRLLITSCLAFAFLTAVKTQTRAPVIWDDAALADWATPIAALQIRPGHYKPADYYAVPADNLRTYPVYLPDKEPPGYWESLKKKKPEPLVDVSKIRTKSDWIEAGARAFRELDNPLSRTGDAALIAAIRDPKTFAGIGGLADGTVLDQRWVVTERGVMLTTWECSGCHARMGVGKRVEYGLPLASRPAGLAPGGVERFLLQLLMLSAERTYGTADPADLYTRMYSVPRLTATMRRTFSLAWLTPRRRRGRFPGVGLGETLRLRSNGVTGAALIANGRIVAAVHCTTDSSAADRSYGSLARMLTSGMCEAAV